MELKFVLITVGTWLLFMMIAIINAIIREGVFSSFLNELRAHQLSTVTLMALFIMVSYLVFRFTEIQLTDQQAFLMGTIWILLTICFEFLAGHYIFNNPWEKLIADYNILKGRIWILIPLTTFIAPYLVKRIIE